MQNANNPVFYMLCTVAQLAADERELFDEDYYNFYTYSDNAVCGEVVCVKRVNVYCAFYVAGEVQDALLHAYMDVEGNLYIDGEQYEEYCI